jgi:hypothetical protein
MPASLRKKTKSRLKELEQLLASFSENPEEMEEIMKDLSLDNKLEVEYTSLVPFGMTLVKVVMRSPLGEISLEGMI